MQQRSSVQQIEVRRFQGAEAESRPDLLAVEEPLEIRMGYGPATDRQQKSIAVTMRTPGNDFELTVGFLYGEGIIESYGEISFLEHCLNVDTPEEQGNVVKVELKAHIAPDMERLERMFYTTSSCGVCGKASIEALATINCAPFTDAFPKIKPSVIHGLGARIASTQTVFRHTGGIHAAAFFDAEGELLCLREDIGRHNAMDKLVGWLLKQQQQAPQDGLVLVSGRASFELVQKAVRAGIPVMAAVGAPSSLAVNLASAYGMSLMGFVRDGRFNVYCGAERIVDSRF